MNKSQAEEMGCTVGAYRAAVTELKALGVRLRVNPVNPEYHEFAVWKSWRRPTPPLVIDCSGGAGTYYASSLEDALGIGRAIARDKVTK